MKKLIIAILLLIGVQSFGQPGYTPINARYKWVAGMFDTALHIPRYNGTPSGLRVGSSTQDGAVAIDTLNNRLYIYSGGAWIRIAKFTETGSPGSSVDSIWRTPGIDSIFYSINSTQHSILDSAGGGTWGSITGTLSDQTDLQAALDLKLNISDTATMLSNYLNNVGYGLLRIAQTARLDSATVFPQIRATIPTNTDSLFGDKDNLFATNRSVNMNGKSFTWTNGSDVNYLTYKLAVANPYFEYFVQNAAGTIESFNSTSPGLHDIYTLSTTGNAYFHLDNTTNNISSIGSILTGGHRSDLIIHYDSIFLKPWLGQVNIDSLRTGTSADEIVTWRSGMVMRTPRYTMIDTSVLATQYDLTTIAVPTLQQVFNTEVGGSVLTKSDTVQLSGNNLRVIGNSGTIYRFNSNGFFGAENTGAVTAITGTSGSSLAFAGSTTSSSGAAFFSANPSSTNSIIPVMVIERITSGTPANGIGGSILFQLERDNNSSSSSTLAIDAFLSDVTSNYTTQVNIRGKLNGANDTLMNIQPLGIVRVNNNADTLATKAYARLVGGGGGGGTGSNLSWNSGTHAVDIDGGGTSAVIPFATASVNGLVSTSTQSFAGYKIFTNGIESNDQIFGNVNSAVTNSIVSGLGLTLTSTGTPANGFGNGIIIETETTPGNTEIGARLEFPITDITAASEDFDFVIKLMKAGAAASEAFRVISTGQLKAANYTSTGAFSGTPIGVLGFDASGNILTMATPGGGSGTVNTGASLKAAYYPSAGTTVDDVTGVEYNNTNLLAKFSTQATTDVGVEIKLASSQSAHALDISSSAGTGDLAYITKDGYAVFPTGTTTTPSVKFGTSGFSDAGDGFYFVGGSTGFNTYLGAGGLIMKSATNVIDFGQNSSFGNTNYLRIQPQAEGHVRFSTIASTAALILNARGGESAAATLRLEADEADDATDTWDITSTTGNDLIFSNNSNNRMEIASGGQLKLNGYGGGSFTGTTTKFLAVTAAGLVIEQTPLVIGTNVQAWDADLDYLATFTPSANVKTVLNAADNAAIKTAIGVMKNLTTNVTDVGNVGAGVDDLMTYSIPAGQLATNGDYIEFTMSFTFAANANNKQVQVLYGGTTIYASGAAAQNDGAMEIKGTIVRTSATTQRITFTQVNNGTLYADYADYKTAAETLSGAITLKATGEATSNDDIVQKILTVKYVPVN